LIRRKMTAWVFAGFSAVRHFAHHAAAVLSADWSRAVTPLAVNDRQSKAVSSAKRLAAAFQPKSLGKSAV
jgi:hypothetical protein